ncbi:MAG: ion channel [Pseudomonadota bacterium]
MLIRPLLLGTVLIVANVVAHVAYLVWLATLLHGLTAAGSLGKGAEGLVLALAIAVLGLIAVHTVSAWVWALIYLAIGEFTELTRALYFSVVTSTTLGYGDVTLSERWRLLASFEAMGGLVLFGASTAFLLGVAGSWFRHLVPVGG